MLGERELADAMLHQLGEAEMVQAEKVTPVQRKASGRFSTDPEWALLAAARTRGLGPGETMSASALIMRPGCRELLTAPDWAWRWQA